MRKYKRGGISLLDGNTFTFVSGARQQTQLPVPGTYMRRLWLNLRGTLTISGVTVPGTVHSDGPANIIQDIELLIDGFPLKKGAGAAFLRIAQKYDQTEGLNTGLVSGAAGVYTFHALIPLLFEMPSSHGRMDSVEDGRNIKNMTLALTWGTTANLIVGNTSTLALSATTCEVYVEDTEANFARQPGSIRRFKEYETSHLGIVTSGGSRFKLDPPSGDSVIRSVQLRAIDGSDLSDTIINTLVALQINGRDEVPLNNIEDDFLQARSMYEFGTDYNPDGYYHIELAENGLVATTGLGAGGVEIKTLDIVADTTVGSGATSVVSHVCELIRAG